MDNEFDSGDDLFDGVDEQDLLKGASQAQDQKHKRDAEESSDQILQEKDPKSTKRQKTSSSPSATTKGGSSLQDGLFQDDRFGLALARRLLADKFEYKDFRHEQEAAIQRVLAGENTLVIFPTGAGKSLCYQIPAIAFPEMDEAEGLREPGSSGVSIVVSPLIALMKDQVDALQRRGITAECLDSTKTWEQVQLTYAALRKGQLRLLYCAPERLNNEGFLESVKDIPGGIRLVAVDEAHCISEWGHSFRPDYLKVSRFVEEIRAERVVCLTATATSKVAEDVCKAFNIDQSCVFRTSPYRPNLQLHAQTIQSPDLNEKFEELFRFLKTHPGPTLVYVALQEQAETHAQVLREKGFVAAAFHAGMKAESKQRIQDDFMADNTHIVCATIAFGMGIDKPNIRNIIHWDLSSTVEEYSQQIGRAGRDGNKSHCMYFLSPGTFYLRENFARGDLPSRQSLKGLLQEISGLTSHLSVDDVFKVSQYKQSRKHDIRANPLSIIYATLELHFGLIRAITPEYTQYSFEATPAYYSTMKTDKSIEGTTIFSNAVKKAKYHHIDLVALAKTTGVNRRDLVKRLNQLNDSGCLKLKTSGLEHRYRILKSFHSVEADIDKLVDALYSDLEIREKDALRRARQVTDLITGSKCFALAIAQHFGMSLPERKPSCGHCTFCITGRPVVLPPEPRSHTTARCIRDVLKATDVRDDPRFLARVAFGIKSPRVTDLRLDKSDVFRSLATHDFDALVREFTRACEEANAK